MLVEFTKEGIRISVERDKKIYAIYVFFFIVKNVLPFFS